MGCGVWGVGFGGWDFGFGVWGLERLEDRLVDVQGVLIRSIAVLCSGFRVQGVGFRV